MRQNIYDRPDDDATKKYVLLIHDLFLFPPYNKHSQQFPSFFYGEGFVFSYVLNWVDISRAHITSPPEIIQLEMLSSLGPFFQKTSSHITGAPKFSERINHRTTGQMCIGPVVKCCCCRIKELRIFFYFAEHQQDINYVRYAGNRARL